MVKKTKPALFPAWLSRLGVELSSGAMGSIILGVIILLGWGVLQAALSPPEPVINEFGIPQNNTPTHPLFGVLVVAGVGLALLCANLLWTILSTLRQETKTPNSVVIAQVFGFNLFVFIFAIPLYLIGNGVLGLPGVGLSALISLFASTLGTYFLFRSFSPEKNLVHAVYGVAVGMLLFGLLALLFSRLGTLFLVLTCLPLWFGCRGLGVSFFDGFYRWIQTAYGVDPLDTKAMAAMVKNTKKETDDEYDTL